MGFLMLAAGRPESKTHGNRCRLASTRRTTDVDCFCPEGVGVRLADDLARSVSKTYGRYAPDSPSCLILVPVLGRSLTRWSATPAAPTASGQNQKHGAQSTAA